MSELKAIDDLYERRIRIGSDPYKIKFVDVRHPPVYLKSEADNVIAEKDAEIARLKNGIAPKQSDKTLQERLNEVCEKHGVSTLQDLDWAFCESEKSRTKDCIEVIRQLRHHKYKRCLAMARWCASRSASWCFDPADEQLHKSDFYDKWKFRWLKLAEKFKPNH